MATPTKKLDDTIRIDGDITANNIAKAGYSNDYNDLVTKPDIFSESRVKTKTWKLNDVKIGTKDNDKYTDPSCLDRCFWVANVEIKGYKAVGLAGYRLSGSCAGVNLYCASMCFKGQKFQDGATTAKHDAVQMQVFNFSGSTKTVDAYWTVLYTKED